MANTTSQQDEIQIRFSFTLQDSSTKYQTLKDKYLNT